MEATLTDRAPNRQGTGHRPPPAAQAAAQRILANVRTRPQRPCAPTIAAAVNPIVDRFEKRHGGVNTRLNQAWTHIVGAELAQDCTPLSLRRGVLTIRASSAAALALSMQSADIVERARNATGQDIRSIRLSQN